MSDDEGWTTVVDRKKDRRGRREERRRYISEELAFKLQRDLDISGLAGVLLSTESRNLQEDGWSFDRVLKNDEDSMPEPVPQNTDQVEYEWLHIPNKWDDRALFSRKIHPS